MAWRLARSLEKLKQQVDATWPGRPTGADGSIGDQAHASRKSDHNPDASGVVRAIDLTEWVRNGVEMNDVLAEGLRASRDPRIKYVICDGLMFSSYATSTRKAWAWGPYSGPNAHTQHVHVSVVADARADDTRPWRFVQEDGDLTAEEKRQLEAALANIQQARKEIEAVRNGLSGLIKAVVNLDKKVTDLH